MKDINVGEFRDKIMFQVLPKSPTLDGGNISTGRSDLVEVYAKVEDASTFERNMLGRKEGTRVVKVTTHYRSDIDNTMGFRWNNENYDITAPIENVGQRYFFMIVKGETE